MKNLLILIFTFLFYTQSFSQWEIISEMPIPVSGAKAIVQDSVIYIFGGDSTSTRTGTKKIQVYYPNSNTWIVLEDSIIVPRYGLSVANYADSVFVFGGATTTNDSSKSIEKWGYHNNSIIKWYNPNFNRSFATTNLVGEHMFIFGGYPDFELYDSLSYMVQFNMLTGIFLDSFAINDSFGVELPSHQMSAVVDNKIYIFGGILEGILRDIHYFDLNAYKWNTLDETLPAPLAGGVALTHPVEDEIILIGGKNEASDALKLVSVFSIHDKMFVEKESLKIARSEHTAVFYNDAIYVFGGKNADGEIINSVEMAALPLNDATATSIENKFTPINRDFELIGNYPNPFNPITDIVINLNRPLFITINIFDITGQKIKTLLNDNLAQGKHRITWNATDNFNRDVTSGIYFYTISSGKLTETNRMLLIK